MQAWLKTCLFALLMGQGLCAAHATPLQDFLSAQAGLDAAQGLLPALDLPGLDSATRELLLRADAHYRAGRLEASIEALEQAHGRTPALPLKLALGELYNRAGRYEDAIRIAREVLPTLPNSALPHDIMGTAYLGLKRPEQARRAYLEVVSRMPQQASGYQRLGDAYWAMGRNGDALAHYQEALKCDSRLIGARLKSAAVLLDLGDTELSLATAQEAIGQAPDAPQAHAVLGEAYLARGDLAGARSHFLAASAHLPDQPYLQERLGEIHLRAGENAQALAVLESSAARNPKHGGTHRLLAKAYALSGQTVAAEYHAGLAASLENRPGEAEGHYRAVLKTEPGHKGALLGLATACLGQDKWAAAALAAERAAEVDPQDAAAFSLLGQAQQARGEIGQAEQSFRRAIRLDARYGPAHLHLARLLQGRLNCEEAIEHYRLAIELGQDGDEVHREMSLCR